MAIEWNVETMSTGLREIDDQHKEWMKMFNEFEEAVLDGSARETLANSLDYLIQYTETHFAAEEAAMQRLLSPSQAENRLAHEQFRLRLEEISSWVRHEGASTVEVIELQMDLEDWLYNHICTIDVHLRDGIKH